MKPQTDAVQAAAFRLLTSGFIQDTTEKSGWRPFFKTTFSKLLNELEEISHRSFDPYVCVGLYLSGLLSG
ncbi:hypothetical protein [Leptospira santarosai]|uniref:hypothetical protein n=1 Tax=Leptospira santarosai TaxID=28183 RepID=UPI00138ECC77|nr:hypothetical protein [Leptospira santarosai]MDI7156760.1 hypothetical protein [Leptospira santarosai]